MQEAWLRCRRADWMLWALHETKHKSFPGPRHFACDCADRALQRERRAGREPDPRLWAAVEAARAYLEGRGTREKMMETADDAVTAGNPTYWDSAINYWTTNTVIWIAETTTNSLAGCIAWAACCVFEEFTTLWNVEQSWQANRLRHYVPEWPR